MLERHALRGPVEELHEAAVQLPEVPEDQRLHLAELLRELALRLHGHRASLLTKLTDDIQLEEAINLIKDKKRFKKLLNVR